MATKSIFKNVVIKDKRLSKNLVSALENAQKKSSKGVQLSKSYREITKCQIKDLFGEKH
ncbi:MAG: hypothetical protein PHS04_19735 [Tissierellia bacterium]|nr:hypothetical protein [Fermentimonas sp.]MDD4440244.1 hypothetical protein [Tissierellia bacterium]